MKEFTASVVKEFRHIFRDRRTILIAMVMPVVQIILFGFAVSTEVNDVRVAVCGDLADPAVRNLVDRIDNNRYLSVSGSLSSPSEITGVFRRNEADAAVCFGRNFGENLAPSGRAQVRIIGDGSDPNTAQMITGYLKGVIQSEQTDAEVAFAGEGERKASMAPVVLELLLVSPVKPLWIILSKMIPYLVLSAVNFATILLLSHYVMEVPINGSLLLLCFAALVFVVTSLALGLLISVISPNQRTALLICGMGLTMPTMIFSGIIFPCESMPEVLQWFSDIIPAKWFIIIVKKIMIQGTGLVSAAKEMTILAGMAALLLAVSIKSFRTRLQ